MAIIEPEQENKRRAASLGFWAALLTAALNVWFYFAYAFYQPIQHAPWRGLSDYAFSFQPLPLLSWVVPCFLLAPMFLTMMTCLYVWSREEVKLWALLALVFAVSYATLMGANYYIQMTVVQHNLFNENMENLSLWLYAYPYPRSFPGALEGTAYGFMCASILFAAQTFGADRLQKWARWTFVCAGLTGLVVTIDPLFRLPLAFLIVDGIAGAISLTLAPVFLALLFRRSTFPRFVQAAAGNRAILH